MLPFGGSVKKILLSTILNEPLWTLIVEPPTCTDSAIPNSPLLTFTQGKVAIPNETSTASLIVPVGVLENPTSVMVIYSSSIFNISDVVIELIPLKINCVSPIPTVLLYVNPSKTPRVWVIVVNVIGCWTTPSRPIIVLLNCLVIDSLWALPEPLPVKVTAAPVPIYSGRVNNSNLFSSITFANTSLGRIVVTIPAEFVVAPIETGVAAIPMKVDCGVYTSCSLVLKKWFGTLNTPVDLMRPTPSASELIPIGLNVLE